MKVRERAWVTCYSLISYMSYLSLCLYPSQCSEKELRYGGLPELSLPGQMNSTRFEGNGYEPVLMAAFILLCTFIIWLSKGEGAENERNKTKTLKLYSQEK